MGKITIGLSAILAIIIIIFVINSNFTNIIPENNTSLADKNLNLNSFPNAVGLHWGHMPLIYEIYNCTDYQANRLIRGFAKIENETKGDVSFLRLNNSSQNKEVDIAVLCRKEYKSAPEPGYTVSGDSGYLTYVNYPNLIAKAEINFYGISSSTYSAGCTIYPDIEVHEILHGFGYGHNESTKSIMYPSHVMCAFKIDDNIITDLKEKYGSS